jgi:hypothetical protein
MRHVVLFSALALLAGCGGSAFTTGNPAGSIDSADDGKAPLEAQPAEDGGAPEAAIPAEDGGGDAGKLGHPEAQADSTRPEAGVPEAGGEGGDAGPDAAPSCPCVSDLSGIGLGDFTIAFTIQTNSTTPMAILNQRGSCGSQPYWDVHTGTNGVFSASEGVVYIEVGDGSNIFDDVSTQKVVNDGQPHHVTIERTDGGTYFTLTVDGVGTAQGIAPLDPLTGTLPTLSTGTDVCTSNGPIAGELTDVCIQRCGK